MTPTFTRQHYIKIAEVVKCIVHPEYRKIVAHDFSRALRADNPRFNEDKFMRACTHLEIKE